LFFVFILGVVIDHFVNFSGSSSFLLSLPIQGLVPVLFFFLFPCCCLGGFIFCEWVYRLVVVVVGRRCRVTFQSGLRRKYAVLGCMATRSFFFSYYKM
jgi:hypothetical protein